MNKIIFVSSDGFRFIHGIFFRRFSGYRPLLVIFSSENRTLKCSERRMKLTTTEFIGKFYASLHFATVLSFVFFFAVISLCLCCFCFIRNYFEVRRSTTTWSKWRAHIIANTQTIFYTSCVWLWMLCVRLRVNKPVSVSFFYLAHFLMTCFLVEICAARKTSLLEREFSFSWRFSIWKIWPEK